MLLRHLLIGQQFVRAEDVFAGIFAEVLGEERAVAFGVCLIHKILLTLRRENADSACGEAPAPVVILKEPLSTGINVCHEFGLVNRPCRTAATVTSASVAVSGECSAVSVVVQRD
jgi:hypothetical protein